MKKTRVHLLGIITRPLVGAILAMAFALSPLEARAQELYDEAEVLENEEIDVADSEIVSGFGGLDPFEWLPTYYDDPGNTPLTLRLEYAHWWLNGNPVPPLVTTNPAGSPALGVPGTRVLFGGDEIDADGRSGFRGTLTVRLAHWFETDVELDGQYLIVGDGASSGEFDASFPAVSVLGRPFFNTGTGLEDVLLVAAPGLNFPDPFLGIPDPTLELESARIVSTTSSDLEGAGVVMRRRWHDSPGVWSDWIAGYRYLRFRERLRITQSQLFRDPADAKRVGTIDSFDSFSTRSEFHGADVGLVTYIQRGASQIELLAKASIGNVHQTLDVRGGTLVVRTDDGTPATTQVVSTSSGLLARPSDVGRRTADTIGVVPEFGITCRRPIFRGMAVTVGYTLIIFPKTLRTGDHINLALDPTQATRPLTPFNDTVLWIQGVNVGLEW